MAGVWGGCLGQVSGAGVCGRLVNFLNLVEGKNYRVIATLSVARCSFCPSNPYPSFDFVLKPRPTEFQFSCGFCPSNR